MSSITRIGNGTTTQACAACKYQRRKCAPDCILAPYFPHDRQRQFLNAHKLFGVSNITKIIKNLNQPDKDEAMRTIIFQSDVRANDPVGGCYRIIRELQRQIEFHKNELDLVLHQLAICRAQTQQQQQPHFQILESDDSATLGCDIVNADSLDIYDPILQYQYAQTQEEQEFVVQDNNQQLQESINALAIQESSLSPSSPSLHLKQPFDNECDDIKPLLDINDVKFEPEELVERKFLQSTQLVISS
ncbi:LOB domain-containing protein, putative [Ricinus communis]|uniref:LOB domain-containing protein, putative n=1 Tax=Ricinus communis TaxID=3988 RepID=B9SN30_RICCO|nr:LOB domain-containing protein, putative [Ricinus communis]|eukprot:XP_002527399.1 LOB domain-containing protein 22 [Ricinus communis]